MEHDNCWERRRDDWWLCDWTAIPGIRNLDDRPLPGHWQVAHFETSVGLNDELSGFVGRMLFANPTAEAPPIVIPLPVTGRYSISVGLLHNYCDRLLVKLERGRCFEHLVHSSVSPNSNSIEMCWWRDVDLVEGDVLVLKQDTAMKRRCAIAVLHLAPAGPSTATEISLMATADGLPGNDGPVDLDQMMANELQFEGTHVIDILHGTDINGAAQYSTNLKDQQYPLEKVAKEVYPDEQYYLWTVQQLSKYRDEKRCPLRDSVTAAHSVGRSLYAYHRMAITRLYAPMRTLFSCPFYDKHPEWRCLDFDGTPISRLSITFPEVRRFFLEQFQEHIEFGCDGVCLVLARGWPLVLFEEPVAAEFKSRTGREMLEGDPNDVALRQVRADFITEFMREIRATVNRAGGNRNCKIVVLTLAQPRINHYYGMDCGEWAREGLVDTVVPYPYGIEAEAAPIDVPEWLSELAGTTTRLCPILNRSTYEPEGIFETPLGLLDKAEAWLQQGVNGFSFWDLDGAIGMPAFRALAFNLGSGEGRLRLRDIFERGPKLFPLKMLDGLAVDRFHPGWNV